MDKVTDKLIPIYKAKHLSKINSMRTTVSQPDVHVVPILEKGQVLFVTAASRNNEPNSCYNCWKYNQEDSTCSILPPSIIVRKFTNGEPFKQIEYWPVCGLQEYGEPNQGEPVRRSESDPDYIGLVWINAPEVGQEMGGANCGGACGGDDCDHWQPPEGTEDKRKINIAFCRVLQSPTGAGDCCAAWFDDDLIYWQEAQAELNK